jgi:hypothetical protein
LQAATHSRIRQPGIQTWRLRVAAVTFRPPGEVDVLAVAALPVGALLKLAHGVDHIHPEKKFDANWFETKTKLCWHKRKKTKASVARFL